MVKFGDIIFILLTTKNPFSSREHKILLLSFLFCIKLLLKYSKYDLFSLFFFNQFGEKFIHYVALFKK